MPPSYGDRSPKEARRAERFEHKVQRRFEKAAEKAARRLAEEARAYGQRSDWVRHRQNRALPIFPGLFASMGLSIAIIVLAVVMRALVPLILTFLSLFFGRGLVVAARATSAAGTRAIRNVEAARRSIHARMERRDPSCAGGEVRVEQVRVGSSAHVRVDVDDDHEVDSEFEDERTRAAGAGRARGGR